MSRSAPPASDAAPPGSLVTQQRFTPAYGQLLRASLARSFNPFNLDEALLHAESVEFNLTTPHLDAWRDWLAHVFQDLQVVDDPRAHATLDAIHGLQQAGATILTTNYDSLLSDVTGLRRSPGRRTRVDNSRHRASTFRLNASLVFFWPVFIDLTSAARPPTFRPRCHDGSGRVCTLYLLDDLISNLPENTPLAP